MTAGRNSVGTRCMALTAFNFCSDGKRSRPISHRAMASGSARGTELLHTSWCVFVYVLYEFGIRNKGRRGDVWLSSESEIRCWQRCQVAFDCPLLAVQTVLNRFHAGG